MPSTFQSVPGPSRTEQKSSRTLLLEIQHIISIFSQNVNECGIVLAFLIDLTLSFILQHASPSKTVPFLPLVINSNGPAKCCYTFLRMQTLGNVFLWSFTFLSKQKCLKHATVEAMNLMKCVFSPTFPQPRNSSHTNRNNRGWRSLPQGTTLYNAHTSTHCEFGSSIWLQA